MKHSKWFGCLLGLLGALGGVGVLVTAMDLGGISFGKVAVFCLIGGFLGSFLSGKWTRLAAPFLLAVATAVAWGGSLERSLESLLYHISRMYMLGYGWSTIRWSGEVLLPEQAELALGFLALWGSYWIGQGFRSRRGSWLAVVAALLPLFPCLLLTDTVPEEKWLFLQLFAVVTLLLSMGAPRRGLFVALPVAAALGLLFVCMPREGYKGQWLAEQFDSWIAGESQPEQEEELHIVIPDLNSQQVDLSQAGPRPSWLIPVMEIQSTENGTIYLRAMAYDRYTGTSWKLDENEAELPLFSFRNAQQHMSVTTRTVHDNLYLPYGVSSVYTGQSIVTMHPKGRVENVGDIREYFIQYNAWNHSQARYGVVSQDKIVAGHGSLEAYAQAQQRYLQLPESTRQWAQSWLNSHLPATGDDTWGMIEAICDLVSQSADYDLSTQRMPKGKDFALWFLEESDTGYCVHYATAAVVLLRAAGIPARYVTGYMVESVAGHMVTVYQKNAHAWVEVYINGGWVPFEPTPSGGVSQTQSPTNPPETTAPPETEETEAPEATTAPVQTSPVGGADKPTKPSTPQQTQQKKPLTGWVKGILWSAGILAAAVAQWQLRLALKHRKRLSPNRQVLMLWRDTVRCGWLLGSKPPEEFHQLAQKAKFSQYTMTRQEILRCREMLNQMKQALQKAGLVKNLAATLVLAIY